MKKLTLVISILSLTSFFSCTSDQTKSKEDAHREIKFTASKASYSNDSLFHRLNDLNKIILGRGNFSPDLFDSFSFDDFEKCSKGILTVASQPDSPSAARELILSILDSCNVEDQMQRDWFYIQFDIYLTLGQLVDKYPQLNDEPNLLLHLDSLMTFPVLLDKSGY